MKRVYIAGKLNDDACGYVKNIYRMVMWAEKVRLLGFAVFVPGIDFLQGVILGNWDYPDYFENSQPWLDVADAMFLTPGWENSTGTKREIERAKQHNIPIYSDIEQLAKELGSVR